MVFKNFVNLIRLELDNYLNLSVFIFLMASAIIAVLFQVTENILPANNYINLYSESGTVFIALTLVASAFLSHSFSGSITRHEVKLLLSYPIKRWQLFMSKFAAMFITIFTIYSFAYSLHLFIDKLSIFEPMFYLSLFAFLIHLLLVCAVSVTISLVTKNEIMSILASILLLLGLDSLAGNSAYLSGQGRFQYLFQYFGVVTHGSLPFGDSIVVTQDAVLGVILVPLSIFALLFFFSFVYFTRIMEID